MSYCFMRCRPHPKCPDLIGWYLVLNPDDFETLERLHRGVTSMYYAKFGLDPHYQNPEIAHLYNPIRLAFIWLETVERQLAAGKPILVNSRGGLLIMADVEVLSAIKSDKMQWPDYDKSEIITIAKWPEGKHYYLSSNKNRVFVPSKYVNFDDACATAKVYTDKIKTRC